MNRKTKSFMTKKKAFTLIELLIVIAIIGILFIVLVSKVDFATDKAKATGVQTDFRSFQMAFDTVAKENSGFNTFGWNTGDLNQDGIRNSYDEGDNGDGGGTAKNGIQDGTEVFTGHKVYSETFTKVFSLKKAKADGTLEDNYDRDALNRLETAINANLDPKLYITIKDDGEIVMANGAQDPWDNEYHGWYITNAENDKQDRGAIVMYSDGANGKFGSEHTISNGIVSVSIPGNNKDGRDDYAIVSCYTYVNGYGEIRNMTNGFSNNQLFNGNSGDVVADSDIGDDNNDGNNDDLVETIAPGGYDANDVLVVSYDDLVNIYGWNVEQSYNAYSGPRTDPTHINQILKNEELQSVTKMVLPNSITKIGLYAFSICTSLTEVWIGDGVELIDQGAFFDNKTITHVEFGKNVKTINHTAFSGCSGLTHVELPNSLEIIGKEAFSACRFETIVIPDSVHTLQMSAFSFCGQLKEIVVPNSVTTMQAGVFNCCYKLEKAILGTGINYIPRMTFGTCAKLVDIQIPENYIKIEEQAFDYCYELTELTLPSGITFIGNKAFNASGIETIKFNGTVQMWAEMEKESNWNYDNGVKTIICSDGNGCVKCSGGVATCLEQAVCDVCGYKYGSLVACSGGEATCQQLAICKDCGNEYGDFDLCQSVNGTCIICNKLVTVVESDHTPYANSQNSVVLGTWDYSDAQSVTITIIAQTESVSYDWAYIKCGDQYLNNNGELVTSAYKFGGKTITTITFENIEMLTGTVIFKTDNYNNQYYGVSVSIVPNY